MSLSQSNEGKLVWERIFKDCDITKLEELEKFRNPDIFSYDY